MKKVGAGILLTGLFLGCHILGLGQELIVAPGDVHIISAAQSETYTRATIGGSLILQQGASIRIAAEALVQPGGTIALEHLAEMAIDGAIDLGDSSRLNMSVASSLRAATLNAVNATITLNNAQLTIFDNAVFNATSFDASTSSFCVFNNMTIRAECNIVVRSSVLELSGNMEVETADQLNFSSAEIRLTGTSSQQRITNCATEIGALVLSGSGRKTLVTADTLVINSALNIGACIMVLNDPLRIAERASISRASGFVLTPSITQYIEGANEVHTFPIGYGDICRMALVRPLESAPGNYTVEFNYGTANNLSTHTNDILNVNSQYYHRIYKSGNPVPANVAIYYSESEGDFNRLVTWNETSLVWTSVSSSPVNVSSPPNLIGVVGRNVTIGTATEANPGPSMFLVGTIEENVPNPGANNHSYAVLRKQLDGGFTLAQNGVLRFIYEEEYPEEDDELNFQLYSLLHESINSLQTVPVQYGVNLIELQVGMVFPGRFAVLEVSNNKGEKWYLKFKNGEL